MASLDVESLFTNVPVQETIEIITEYVYNHPDIEPPKITIENFKKLLLICTTECPFLTPDGKIFVQIDGISMGCVLGPTFANFYMGHLEQKILKHFNLDMYTRYVDDIFVSSNSLDQILQLKASLERESILKFTIENEKYNKTLNFLDVHLSRKTTKFVTEVHVKSTNDGGCINFDSICPNRYKTGVIKSFLHRAYMVSSTWEVFNVELKRIKQTLVNNNFPLSIIDKTIKEFLDKKNEKNKVAVENKQDVKLFFKAQMTQNYVQREDQLKAIIKNNTKATENMKIKFHIYYKNRKLKNLLLKNNPKERPTELETSHVVYQYTCPYPSCHAGDNYIGYTTNRLSHRCSEHEKNGSIRKHHETTHNNRPSLDHILENTKILKRGKDWCELQIMESIIIKDKKPRINRQFANFKRYLNIF